MSSAGRKSDTVAHQVVEWLENQGVETVFLVPGAQVDPLVDALSDSTIQTVCAQHELGAAYMADGLARLTGGIGVCLMGGGPGVAYAVSAAVTARIDRQPILFISGAPEPASSPSFQDVGEAGGRDQAIMATALDHAFHIGSTGELAPALNRIRDLLSTPAPAHLCLPLDIQRAPAVQDDLTDTLVKASLPLTPGDHQALEALLRQDRVLVLAGPGCVTEAVSDLLLQVLERHHLPLVTTFDAKGVIDERHDLALGAAGYAATPRAHMALDGLDGLILLGTDHMLRDMAGDLVKTPPSHSLIQSCGSQTAVFGRRIPATCRTLLEAMQEIDVTTSNRAAWLAQIRSLPPSKTFTIQTNTAAMDLMDLIGVLRESVPSRAPLFCDAGLYRRFLGHLWMAEGPRTLFVASHTAPMGWGIAGAVGAAAARPGAPVFALVGDGCMRMLGLEIATAVQNQLPLKLVISDNGLLGSVYLRSQGSAAERLARSPDIDWVGLAKSLGASGREARTAGALRQALQDARNEPGPSIIRAFTQTTPFD